MVEKKGMCEYESMFYSAILKALRRKWLATQHRSLIQAHIATALTLDIGNVSEGSWLMPTLTFGQPCQREVDLPTIENRNQ